MRLSVTTREVELFTTETKGTSDKISIKVEVAKVDEGKLVFIESPNMIRQNPQLEGVIMDDIDQKGRLLVHIIFGPSDFAKLKTDQSPRVGQPG